MTSSVTAVYPIEITSHISDLYIVTDAIPDTYGGCRPIKMWVTVVVRDGEVKRWLPLRLSGSTPLLPPPTHRFLLALPTPASLPPFR